MTGSNLTYQQQAYGFIKKQIMNLGFKPGEYITDIQIAVMLKISRTPVHYQKHLGWRWRRGGTTYAGTSKSSQARPIYTKAATAVLR